MWEPTPELNIIFFSCILVVFALIGYAWVGLYKLWNRHFHHKLISGVYQTMKLFGWLLLVAATIFSSIIMLWFFWLVVSVLLL